MVSAASQAGSGSACGRRLCFGAHRIAGFYTLSATAIALRELPESFAKKLPRYPLVPAILIGRLARDVNFPGVGQKLLVDTLQRALKHATPIAAAAVLVDAKDDRAASFYQQLGFLPVATNSRQLFLPMSVIEKLDHNVK